MKKDMWRVATHVPLLVRAFTKTEGDVLEVGTGYFSTLVLRWLATMSGRKLVSYESSPSWYRVATKKQSENHEVVFCKSWDEADFDKRHWGLIFIDHGPNKRRHVEIERLKDKCDIMVIHDTEPESDAGYLYSRIWPLFKYKYDFTLYKPWTSAVSNTVDVSILA